MKGLHPIHEIEIIKDRQNKPEFMQECEDQLCRKILSIYKELFRSGQKEKTLIVRASLDGVTADSPIIISTDNLRLLKKVLGKHFEEMGDDESGGRTLRISATGYKCT